MLRAISRGFDRLYLLAGWLSGAMMVLLLCLVTFNILARLLGIYSGGTSEYSGYVMAAGTFLALAYTFRSDGHIRVSLLIDSINPAARHRLQILTSALMAITVCYLAWYCVTLVIDSFVYGEKSDGADATPLWIVQIPMAVGAVIFAMSCIHGFLLTLIGEHPTQSEIVKAGEVQEI